MPSDNAEEIELDYVQEPPPLTNYLDTNEATLRRGDKDVCTHR